MNFEFVCSARIELLLMKVKQANETTYHDVLKHKKIPVEQSEQSDKNSKGVVMNCNNINFERHIIPFS